MGGGRWEVGVGGWDGGRWEVRWGWEGFGSVWCGPKYFGSVRYGSGRFDTILGESIVETAMGTMLRRNPTALRLPPLTACLCRPQCYRRAA